MPEQTVAVTAVTTGLEKGLGTLIMVLIYKQQGPALSAPTPLTLPQLCEAQTVSITPILWAQS